MENTNKAVQPSKGRKPRGQSPIATDRSKNKSNNNNHDSSKRTLYINASGDTNLLLWAEDCKAEFGKTLGNTVTSVMTALKKTTDSNAEEA
jgi:hypothetical protein